MKKNSMFFCSSCGYESAKWLGQCPSCRKWNSFTEETVIKAVSPFQKSDGHSKPLRIMEIELEKEDRLSSGFQELDRVLGGGIVRGSLVLLGGDPGIGKSTILLEVSRNLSAMGKKVLYASGEESLKQIKMRAERIGNIEGDLFFLSETSIESILSQAESLKPDILIIDSIQTMYTEMIQASSGSVSQVRECASRTLRFAKEKAVSVFMVGHVTKDGSVAGPKVLEHMVDTVLYFEGDSTGSLRILHSQKNRFGSTNEIGVFEMCEDGLKEMLNPSELLLSGRPLGAKGSVVTCGFEGTRPLLVEIQGLLTQSAYSLPRRTANGFDFNRLNMLIAIIEKRLKLPVGRYDAYVNITGGLHIAEPSMDLAIILSLISSYLDKEIPDDIIAFGEVGLSGEVRGVQNAEQRVQEAMRLGFNACIMPSFQAGKLKGISDKIKIFGVSNLSEAVRLFRAQDI